MQPSVKILLTNETNLDEFTRMVPLNPSKIRAIRNSHGIFDLSRWQRDLGNDVAQRDDVVHHAAAAHMVGVGDDKGAAGVTVEHARAEIDLRA